MWGAIATVCPVFAVSVGPPGETYMIQLYRRVLCWVLNHDVLGPDATLREFPRYRCQRCKVILRWRMGGGWQLAKPDERERR